MPYSCIEIFTDITESDLQAYYSFHQKLMTALNKQLKSFAHFSKRAIELLAIPNRRECLLLNNDIVIGWLEAVAYNTSPTDKALALTGDLLEPINDTIFEAEVKQLIKQWTTAFNAPHIFIKSNTDYKQHLVEFLKGRQLDEQRYMKIETAALDRKLLQQWIDDTNLQGLREEAYTLLPEKYLAQFVATLNAGLKDIPNNLTTFTPYFTVADELERIENRKNTGAIQTVLLLFTEENKIAAFTNVLTWQNNATAAQALTYVLPELRNRKLAKYLKAKMTLYVADNYPEIKGIATDCYARNTPMIHINEQAGFKYTKSGFDYVVNA
ncbi:MAG: hypothetical protein KA149_10280 [Chitinophagales bacterium]|nr:hypothetical protein [Chitinophagales bacterium]